MQPTYGQAPSTRRRFVKKARRFVCSLCLHTFVFLWQFTAASCIVAQGISLQDHCSFAPSPSICSHVRAVYAESHAVEQQGNCLGVERRPPLVNLEQND